MAGTALLLAVAAGMAAYPAVAAGAAYATPDGAPAPPGLPPGMFSVADSGNHRIQVFHPGGALAFEFGSYGSGPGQFSSI